MADNTNLSRMGQVNKSGDVFALFRDQFVAELITEFDAQRKVQPFVRFKQIEKGKSGTVEGAFYRQSDFSGTGSRSDGLSF